MAKAKGSAVSNEEIIAALLSCPTRKAAAEAVGIGERTIYDRMQEKDFKEQYKTARAEILRGTVVALTRHMGEAVETIADIMKDQTAAPATRLQAAQAILTTGGRYIERLQQADSIAEAERDRLFF